MKKDWNFGKDEFDGVCVQVREVNGKFFGRVVGPKGITNFDDDSYFPLVQRMAKFAVNTAAMDETVKTEIREGLAEYLA